MSKGKYPISVLFGAKIGKNWLNEKGGKDFLETFYFPK